MKLELVKWSEPTILYVIDVNNMVKFGITSDWSRRSRQYEKELGDVEFQLLKQIEFETRWQAELIEQVVKWRLRPWVVLGRHEWIKLPVQPIMDCISQTIKEIETEYAKHKFIHARAEERWDFYKQIAQMYFVN